MIKKLLIITLLLFSFLSKVKSQNTGEYALYVIKNLCSERFLGRQAGTSENEKTINFIKEELLNIGLSYSQIFIQKFPLDIYFLEEKPKLQVYFNKRILWEGIYRKNFRDLFTGSWEIQGKINFVNYGLNLNDYKDSNGKISIAQLGYENPKDRYLDRIEYRINLAQNNSSLALFLITDKTKEYIVSQKSLFLNDFSFPVVFLTTNSWNNIKKYYYKNSNIEIKYKIKYRSEKGSSTNLYLFIPGREDKYIIISAHIDHVGGDPDGSFFPGANDNASGVGVLMEIIRIIKERNILPKYNLIFSFFNGEEYGLKGSNHYVKNPIFPLNKTLLNINLDCVGRGKYIYLAYNHTAEEYVDRLREFNKKIIPIGEHHLLTQSDQFSFVNLGIPAIFISRANEDLNIPDLHQSTDTYEKISYQNLAEVIDLIIKFIC
ncbi:MAG: M28 family peptidase [Dictyoglomus sp.]|nr:M28 family peptidase [Dictyoglomus sp.]MCX7942298.1 M28 family peptidase [Dictyoglomaceae bacterium]MDW8187874.1 M28 family peptidase [Dictyoglomus sp.]